MLGDIYLQGSFSFGESLLFNNLSMTLKEGCWTCLLGPSGVGKSTLLRLIAGLSTGGEFNGSIRSQSGDDLDGQVAYMAQSDLLFPWLTVANNVQLGSRLRGMAPDGNRARKLIDKVALGDHIDKFPRQLSGGMRQRVALARTLMEDHGLVLLDEPFSALDARTRAEMQEQAFDALFGKTVMLVTHDPAEAARMAHHIYLFTRDGLEKYDPPGNNPIRSLNDEHYLAYQARLLEHLRSLP